MKYLLVIFEPKDKSNDPAIKETRLIYGGSELAVQLEILYDDMLVNEAIHLFTVYELGPCIIDRS